jgi:hypothetical protein
MRGSLLPYASRNTIIGSTRPVERTARRGEISRDTRAMRAKPHGFTNIEGALRHPDGPLERAILVRPSLARQRGFSRRQLSMYVVG